MPAKTGDNASGAIPRRLLKPPPAFPDMRIGLLGGTFDPPHSGHVHISELALKRLSLDRLWWLVTPGNPLKHRPDLAPFAKRLAQSAEIARHPRVEVTGFEAGLGSSYSVETLAFLKRRYPATRFVWVMGADNLADFHLWRSWRRILNLMPVAVMDRPGFRFAARAGRAARAFDWAYVEETDARGLADLPPPAWSLLTVPLSAVSSTKIRSRTRRT